MAAGPAPVRSLRGELDAWLTLTADLIITTALLQSSSSAAMGLSLPWSSVLLPAILANSAASFYARRNGLTALAFGPNTVFIVVFGRAVLDPKRLEWQNAGWSLDARVEASVALLGASLVIYALIVAVGVFTMVRWRPVLPRRALVLPLAAICWTHLVGNSIQALAHENVAIWLPAILLFALLYFTTKGPFTWVFVIATWWALSFVLPPAASKILAIPTDTVPIRVALLDADALTVWGSFGFWRDVFPLLAALGLANSFGILENVAAAWEVGDRHSAKTAVATSSAGTMLGAIIGSGAPVTVYIGHPAFRARGARWLYVGLAAISLLGVLWAVEHRLLEWFPIAIFHGAVLYLGVMVGLLPRKHLLGGVDLAKALVVTSPIGAGWLVTAFGLSEHLLLGWLGRGGGLVSVAWGLLLFEALSPRERTIICGALAIGSVLGLVHATAASPLALATVVLYVVIALTGRSSAPVR